jgi:hypothetical protein
MAPVAIPIIPDIQEKDTVQPKKDTLGLPESARKRLEKAGIDLSNGYPYRPAKPLYLDDAYNIRNYDRPYTDPGSRADPEKRALLSAAKDVIHLTTHIGTEIVGLQLKDLTDQQKDELGLLIAERSVVFFRDQDISPQEQKKLGEWYGEVEVHVSMSSDFEIVVTDDREATSSIGAGSSWHYRDMACIASHRVCSKFQTNRRCFEMAY